MLVIKTFPLFISAVNYAKPGLIDAIYAKSSFGAQAMILTRAEMVYLIKEHSQIFYIDERSYSFQVYLLKNGVLSNQESPIDSLGSLKSFANQLGEIPTFEKNTLTGNAKKYIHSLGAAPKSVGQDHLIFDSYKKNRQ